MAKDTAFSSTKTVEDPFFDVADERDTGSPVEGAEVDIQLDLEDLDPVPGDLDRRLLGTYFIG